VRSRSRTPLLLRSSSGSATTLPGAGREQICGASARARTNADVRRTAHEKSAAADARQFNDGPFNPCAKSAEGESRDQCASCPRCNSSIIHTRKCPAIDEWQVNGGQPHQSHAAARVRGRVLTAISYARNKSRIRCFRCYFDTRRGMQSFYWAHERNSTCKGIPRFSR